MVAESGAIIEYILHRHGRGRLQPVPSSASHDEHLFWIHYAEGSVMPALIVRIIAAQFGEAAAASLPRFDSQIALHLNYINTRLQGRLYLLGDELTAADIQLGFVAGIAASRFGIGTYPNIDAWGRRFQARPAYKAAAARGEVPP